MANYYYVKTGGTATGDAGRYTTQQTGSFATLGAANYYASVQTMIDNIVADGGTFPVLGDFINPSDLHTESVVVDQDQITFGVNIVAVDDANIDAGRTSGNFAQFNSTGTCRFGPAYHSGVSFEGTNNFGINSMIFDDVKISTTGGSRSAIWVSSDGYDVRISNALFLQDSATSELFNMGGGGVVSATNIIIDGYGGLTQADSISTGGFTNGGGSVQITDSDLSFVDGTLFAGVGANLAADDAIDIRLDNCKLHASVVFTDEVFASQSQRALFTRCSDSSAAAEYQYHLHAFGGDVWDEASIHRNQDTAFTESNQKISYKIETNSDASLGFPLWFDFPMSQFVTLTTTSTLEFYITCATALTDKDIYVTVGYTDSVNKNTTNNVISAPETVGGTLDLLATGTTLTTDATSTWTGALANLYKIVIDCPNGADCQPTIRINATKASTALYIASEPGIS